MDNLEFKGFEEEEKKVFQEDSNIQFICTFLAEVNRAAMDVVLHNKKVMYSDLLKLSIQKKINNYRFEIVLEGTGEVYTGPFVQSRGHHRTLLMCFEMISHGNSHLTSICRMVRSGLIKYSLYAVSSDDVYKTKEGRDLSIITFQEIARNQDLKGRLHYLD